MIPVDQTICNFKNGDCFSACVASILELPIIEIPNFMQDGENKFDYHVEQFEKDFGIASVDFDYTNHKEALQDFVLLMKNRHLVATGPSPRNKKKNHAVLWYNDKMAHDPHPDKTGLLEYPELFTIMMVVDAKKLSSYYN